MVKRFTYGGNRGNKEKMKIIGGESGKENGEVVTEVVSIFFSSLVKNRCTHIKVSSTFVIKPLIKTLPIVKNVQILEEF